MKYQVNMFYSLQVEAESKEQAEEKAGEYIASEEGQGVRLSDMSIEVESVVIPKNGKPPAEIKNELGTDRPVSLHNCAQHAVCTNCGRKI